MPIAKSSKPLSLWNPLVRADAFVSDCGHYRYTLTREWWEQQPDCTPDLLCWIMLNPSTADASKDDPTIRRCMSFAQQWGYDGILVVNLFAYRATDPKELRHVEDIVGSCNDAVIASAVASHTTIAAWGRDGAYRGRDRKVLALVKDCELLCLGITKEGQPKHPLYLAKDTEPIRFGPAQPR